MYTINLEVNSAGSEAEVQDWLTKIQVDLPDGVEATVKRDEKMLGVEQLTEENVGQVVRFDQPHGQEVEGVLEALFPWTNRGGYARVLVVEGAAYPLTYALVFVRDQ